MNVYRKVSSLKYLRVDRFHHNCAYYKEKEDESCGRNGEETDAELSMEKEHFRKDC